MKNFTSYLKKAFGITLVLIVLCGVVYPLVMTGAGQLLFKKQANGSMIPISSREERTCPVDRNSVSVLQERF